MARRRLSFSLAILGALTVTDAGARGPDPTLTARLTWENAAGGSCLDADSLQKTVERHLERTVFVSADRADVELRVHVERTARSALTVLVEVRNREGAVGARTLESPLSRCNSLQDMLALVAAMLLDGPRAELDAEHSESPPPDVTSPSAAPKAAPTTQRRPHAPEASSATSPRWHAEAAALGEGMYGVLPGIALGAGVSGFILPPRFPPVFLAADALPSASRAETNGQIDFRALVLSAGVAPIDWALTEVVRARGILACSAGPISAKGSGFDENLGGSRWFFGLSFDAELSLKLGSGVFAMTRAGLLVPFVRPAFTYEGPEGPVQVHRLRAAGASVGLGLGWGSRQ